MKKTIGILIAVAVIGSIAFWAKGYYNDRYVASETYYTQIPVDEINEDSWLVDSAGTKQEKGKTYDLFCYDKEGNQKSFHFLKKGTAKDYYPAGTYIKINASKTISLGESVVSKDDVPKKALLQIQQEGTEKK